MFKTWFFKLLFIVIIGVILVTSIFGIRFINGFYNNIFRLSFDNIYDSLYSITSQCKKISDCNLLPGDILIRRYITQKTWLFDKLANPYFTHTAFYLGDDQIVEAVGKERKPDDEIQIASLSKSDWFNSDINDFVIIRPNYPDDKLEVIKNNLKTIANNPDYKFGISRKGNKRFTCADLIFNQLDDKISFSAINTSKMMTPDYLFWLTKQSKTNFEIVGYNLSI